MNNWHRKIWTLDEISSGDPLFGLFKSGGTNQFWFEPYVDPTLNVLQFKVQYKSGQMVDDWSTCTLEAYGTSPFISSGTTDDTTERLEGPIKIGSAQPIVLKIYMTTASTTAASTGGGELLRLFKKSAFTIKGGGDTGGATAHN